MQHYLLYIQTSVFVVKFYVYNFSARSCLFMRVVWWDEMCVVVRDLDYASKYLLPLPFLLLIWYSVRAVRVKIGGRGVQ